MGYHLCLPRRVEASNGAEPEFVRLKPNNFGHGPTGGNPCGRRVLLGAIKETFLVYYFLYFNLPP